MRFVNVTGRPVQIDDDGRHIDGGAPPVGLDPENDWVSRAVAAGELVVLPDPAPVDPDPAPAAGAAPKSNTNGKAR